MPTVQLIQGLRLDNSGLIAQSEVQAMVRNKKHRVKKRGGGGFSYGGSTTKWRLKDDRTVAKRKQLQEKVRQRQEQQ